MSLRKYVEKRDFSKTSEPKGGTYPRSAARRFVIQKHAASHLHYDFRLEIGGTLKSWAVPKGVPFAKGEKRLAMHVEDHPISYRDFEGVIPKGQYGGGTVMVWDYGSFQPLSQTPAKDLDGGKLHFILHGKKLSGEWYLVRMHNDDKQWLLIRGGETMKPVSKTLDDTSALSKKSMKQLAQGERVWNSKPAKPKSARTLLPFFKPMMAKLLKSPPPGDWQYEIKYDGFRAVAFIGNSRGANGVRLISRNEKDLAGKFPEVLKSLEKLHTENTILDGEVVALDEKGRSSFQLLQAYELGEKKPPLIYYVFDIPQDGEDLRSRPLEERQERLREVLRKAPRNIRVSEVLGGDGEALMKQAHKLGLEGLIGKRPDSTYEAGRRSGAWIKVKTHHEQEFVIGGYTDPTGARNHIGALLIGVFEKGKLLFCGKVGTGFSAALLRALHADFQKLQSSRSPFEDFEAKRCHWLKPKLVCQVRFSEWTSDGKLRQPVFLGIREDKDATDVKREEDGR